VEPPGRHAVANTTRFYVLHATLPSTSPWQIALPAPERQEFGTVARAIGGKGGLRIVELFGLSALHGILVQLDGQASTDEQR
jgi:hypothetical protein